MRCLKLYRHGFTLGTNSHSGKTRPRGERGNVGGWSHGSTSRNIAFLRSVNENLLCGHAFAITLTFRDCPESSDIFHQIRDLFIRRLKRLHMIRLHWVVEWQRRGLPHLHCAAFFDDKAPTLLPALIVSSWCDLVKEYKASPLGQYVLPINDAIGWFQYVSKHAARGVGHYQRSPENIPSSWHKKTGRMWGKVGNWPTVDKVEFLMSDSTFYQFRRICKRWRLADSRSAKCNFRIRSAKKFLQCPKSLSTVLGVSEWMPEQSLLQILFFLKSQGYEFL